MKIGILPLGRATFDVAFADDTLAAMLAALDATGHEIVGPRELLFDEAATRAGMAGLEAAGVDQVLILQVTFTDASMAVAIGAEFGQPLSIWSVPEPRLGGRLRLNSFCGLNLASHALSLRGREFGWLYADPARDVDGDLADLLAGRRAAGRLNPLPPPSPTPEGLAIAESLRGKRIARIGEHPAGFDTCVYDAGALKAMSGVEVDEMALDALFASARAAPALFTSVASWPSEAACRASASQACGSVTSISKAEHPDPIPVAAFWAPSMSRSARITRRWSCKSRRAMACPMSPPPPVTIANLCVMHVSP